LEIVTLHKFESERKENTMTRKERIDMVLAKIPEDKREAFVAQIREAKDPKERAKVLEEYGVAFTEEEKKAFRTEDEAGNEVSDDELDRAADRKSGE
jgi:hypothetical protein